MKIVSKLYEYEVKIWRDKFTYLSDWILIYVAAAEELSQYHI